MTSWASIPRRRASVVVAAGLPVTMGRRSAANREPALDQVGEAGRDRDTPTGEHVAERERPGVHRRRQQLLHEERQPVGETPDSLADAVRKHPRVQA
jgi:hypothetical protein